MKRIVALCAISALVVGVSAAHAAVETNEVGHGVVQPAPFPCANGGVGEIISGDVQLHVLITSTVNGNKVSGKFHFQPQGFPPFVGETTGDVYRATGVTQGSFNGSLTNGQHGDVREQLPHDRAGAGEQPSHPRDVPHNDQRQRRRDRGARER